MCASGRAPLREIAAAADMSRSQTHRYLAAYVNTGLVTQDPLTGFYALGPTAVRIGLSAISRIDVIQQSAAELRELVDTLGYTGLLSTWGDYGPTIVVWIDGQTGFTSSLSLGSVLPLESSSVGRVFLAFDFPSKVLNLLNLERATGKANNLAELIRTIKIVRRRGYAAVRGDVVPGLTEISVPVFDMAGWPRAVISVVGSAADKHFLSTRNINAALSAGRRASIAIGWVPAAGPAILTDRAAGYLERLATDSTSNTRANRNSAAADGRACAANT